MAKAPGRSEREGVTLIQLMEMFPTEDAARQWFEAHIWSNGRHCPHCGSVNTVENKGREARPYHCRDCKQHFSVRINTILERSKVSLKQWAIAIYLHTTSLKGVSSMKLHRDIGVTQKTAWFMLQRIRQAWSAGDLDAFTGPVEADETYMGGREKNKHAHKKLNAGRGAVGKTAVAGVKDRATNQVKADVVKDTCAKTLQGFVVAATLAGATVYTDDASAYLSLDRNHEAVKHSVGEYNAERPHEALRQMTPASLWQPPERQLPKVIEPPWYDADHQARKVRPTGEIKWRGGYIFIGEALAREPVGIHEIDDGIHLVRFCGRDLGTINHTGRFHRFHFI